MKLWAVLRTYGLEGLRAHIRSGVDLAAYVAELVADDERLRAGDRAVAEPGRLPATSAGDEPTLAAMEASTPAAWPTSATPWSRAAPRCGSRSAAGARRCADIDRTWRALQEAAAAQLSG